MSTCVFCEILAERAAGSFVYRDDRVSAILDIHQQPQGHVLVMPHVHVARLAELDPDLGAQIFRVGQRIAAALRETARDSGSFPCQGINLFLADGPAAGQEVDHVHLHVMARSIGDGFGVRLPHGPDAYPSRTKLDEMAREIHLHAGE